MGATITFAEAPTIYFGLGGLAYSSILGLFAAIAEFWLPAWILAASIFLLRKPRLIADHL